jgi:hypothetical protein
MSRAGQRARLDRLLEAIGPKIQRIRVEGAGTAEELSGPEPPFIVNETTGKRTYVSPNTLGMLRAKKRSRKRARKKAKMEAAKASASPSAPSDPPRLPTHEEVMEATRKEWAEREAKAAALAAAKPKP